MKSCLIETNSLIKAIILRGVCALVNRSYTWGTDSSSSEASPKALFQIVLKYSFQLRIVGGETL